MGTARIRVDYDMLKRALGFPPEAIIVGVRGDIIGSTERQIEIVATHSGFPQQEITARLPLFRPVYQDREGIQIIVDWIFNGETGHGS